MIGAMNYIKHLTGFFDRIVLDRNLNPTHISLYIALFQYWNINRFRNPISITRDEVMRISKIASKATYHKCMKELHSKGYIKYQPSFNPFKGSMVILFNFSEPEQPVHKMIQSTEKNLSNNEQVLNRSRTGYRTSSEQALVPSINNINNLNNSNILNGNAHVNSEKENLSIPKIVKEKSCAKKEKSEILEASQNCYSDSSPPSIEELEAFFVQHDFPDLEAKKFFNHYSSNGWLIGGKSPMVDWKAAARNWIINSANFQVNQVEDRTKQLNVTTNKDYSEPL